MHKAVPLMLLTLIPLGMGHTYFGTSAANATATLIAASFATIIASLVLYRCELPMAPKGSAVLKRLWYCPRLVFLTLVCAAAFLSSYVISGLMFNHMPGVPDSISQYVHGRLIANGNLTTQGLARPEFFPFPTAIANHSGRWLSQYPPGHLFVLALGHWSGAINIIVPLLAASGVLLCYLLAREVASERIARISALLTVTSPFVLLMSSEYMSHTTAMPLATAFVLFLLRTARSGKWHTAALAGTMVGLLFVTRPYTAALTGIGAAFMLLLMRRRIAAKLLFAAIAALAPWLVLQLAYNAATTGDPWLYAYKVRFGATHIPGFGLAVPADLRWYAHDPLTLWRAVGQLSNNLIGLNLFLFAWPLPALSFAIIAPAARRRYASVLLAIPASLALGHAAYFYQDWCFGPRFLYEAVPELIVLTALGLHRCTALARKRLGRNKAITSMRLLILALYATGLPLFANGSFWATDNGLREAFRPQLLQKLHEAELGNALVFVPKKLYPLVATTFPPDASKPLLCAVDLGSRNTTLMNQFPMHKAYRWSHGALQEIVP